MGNHLLIHLREAADQGRNEGTSCREKPFSAIDFGPGEELSELGEHASFCDAVPWVISAVFRYRSRFTSRSYYYCMSSDALQVDFDAKQNEVLSNGFMFSWLLFIVIVLPFAISQPVLPCFVTIRNCALSVFCLSYLWYAVIYVTEPGIKGFTNRSNLKSKRGSGWDECSPRKETSITEGFRARTPKGTRVMKAPAAGRWLRQANPADTSKMIALCPLLW